MLIICQSVLSHGGFQAGWPAVGNMEGQTIKCHVDAEIRPIRASLQESKKDFEICSGSSLACLCFMKISQHSKSFYIFFQTSPQGWVHPLNKFVHDKYWYGKTDYQRISSFRSSG